MCIRDSYTQISTSRSSIEHFVLLADDDSLFSRLVADTGSAAENLRALAAEGFVLPPRSLLLAWLHAAGYSAAPSHMEGKGLKTSASLAELVAVVAARRDRGDLSVVLDLD